MNDDTASGRNEYDLKIAILESAMQLVKNLSVGENPRVEDRRFVLGSVRLLKRAFGIVDDASPSVGEAATSDVLPRRPE